MFSSEKTLAPTSPLMNKPTVTAQRGRFGRLRRLLLSDYFVLYLTIIMYVTAAIILPRLGRPNTLALPGNIANQFTNIWPLLAVAIGQTFVLIIGGIDLSVGATMGITSVVGGLFMAQTLDAATFDKSPLWGSLISEQGGILLTRFGSNENAVLIGILIMLGIGLLIGFLNGVAITRFRMAPFMVTLVTLTFFSSFALWLTGLSQRLRLARRFFATGQRGYCFGLSGAKT